MTAGTIVALAVGLTVIVSAGAVGGEIYTQSADVAAAGTHATAAGQAAPGAARGHAYGAMAIAPSLEVSGRTAVFFATAAAKGSAIRRAVASCTRYARDCRALVWVKNGYVAAVYQPVRNGAYGFGWGTSRARALTGAEHQCAARANVESCLRPPIRGRTVTGASAAPGRNAVGGPPAKTQIQVPFSTQNGTGLNNCGPAAITMVIRYYRGTTTVKKTAGAMRGRLISSGKGTTALRPGPDSVSGERGYTNVTSETTQWWLKHQVAGLSEQRISTLSQIKSEIDNQRPVIVLIRTPAGNHYIVITGYDSRNVYINNPSNYGPSTLSIAGLAAAESKVKGGQQAVSIGYFPPPQPSPLLDASLAVTWTPVWVLWIYLLFQVISEITRSRDLSGRGKAAWLIIAITLPLVGVFAYLHAARVHDGVRTAGLPDGRMWAVPPGPPDLRGEGRRSWPLGLA